MTGRDLIIYILTNHLEDEPVFKDGAILGFISVEETAAKLDVGAATIYAWIQLGKLPSVVIGNTIYIPANFDSPFENEL